MDILLLRRRNAKLSPLGHISGQTGVIVPLGCPQGCPMAAPTPVPYPSTAPWQQPTFPMPGAEQCSPTAQFTSRITAKGP